MPDPQANMMHLTFTCTAMPRPETLRRSLDSLRDKLGGCSFHQSTLLINIDPMTDAGFDEEREHCVRIAESNFAKVISNRPNTPNFALAVRWLWLEAMDEFIVHWEDDWELRSRVDVGDLITLMQQRNLDHLMLRAWRWSNYPFCLGPGILRRRFYRRSAEALVSENNPEKTIRALIANTQYAQHVHPPDCGHVIVQDLGRAWMRASGYVRGEGDFVSWQRRTAENAVIDDRLADQNAELTPTECVDRRTPQGGT